MLKTAPNMATETAATIMVFTLLPSHTMRTGASADLGRLFKSTIYGSAILKTIRNRHINIAHSMPAAITMEKHMRVS